MNLPPVSYTHLDVYKRQDMNFKADKMLAEAAQIEEETFGRVMDAVRP